MDKEELQKKIEEISKEYQGQYNNARLLTDTISRAGEYRINAVGQSDVMGKLLNNAAEALEKLAEHIKTLL